MRLREVMSLLAFVLGVVFSGDVGAQELIPALEQEQAPQPSVAVPEPAPVPAQEPIPAQMPAVIPAKPPRTESNYLASLNYSAADFPIPNKFGATVGLVTSPTQTWELEYMKGAFSVPGGFRDLASINDTRIGVIGRSFFGKSFHISYGVSYFDFSANLGDKLMSGISGGKYPEVDIMTNQGFGLNLGIGNTWVFKKKFTLGIDWISWAQPLVPTNRSSAYTKYATNEDFKKSVDDTMKILSYLPRFSLLNLHLGLLF